MTYVLRPRHRRLEPLKVNVHGWWFILDHVNPQFVLALHPNRLPDIARKLRNQDGFEVAKRESLLMARYLRENTAALEMRWPLVDEFAGWAEQSNGFSINNQ